MIKSYYPVEIFHYLNRVQFLQLSPAVIHMVTVKIDNAQINGVRKAGLTVYESVSLGTQRSVRINRVRFKGGLI